MGKLSSIFLILMMVNVVGYIVFADYVATAENPYIANSVILNTLYEPVVSPDGGTVYLPTQDSQLGASIPDAPPESFIESAGAFIDRIFTVFDFLRAILAVLAFPVALVGFMGLPWQLSMLTIVPLTVIYVFGFIDLLGGGDN